MTTNTNAALDVLMAYADGRINHDWAGSCPDGHNGPASRNPSCPVCQALDAVAAVPPASRHAENVALLADILKRRPAMNAGLAESYAQWTQEVYDLMGATASEPANDDSLAAAPKAEPVPAVQQGDELPREDFAWLVVQEACETEPADEDDPECIRILRRDLKSAVLSAFLRHDAAHPAAPVAQRDVREETSIGKAVNRAARDLPEGWEIRIDLERHAGVVHLIDPEGNETMIEGNGELFSDQISAAIDAASSQSKEGA